MKLHPSDPDIQTLVARIRAKDINLQPNFQRGEVWGTKKKQRLIDTILRDWHVPPIHVVVVEETGQQEVLDGQQRLVAIRDFVSGELHVDGSTEPPDSEIAKLTGLTYDELPPKFRRQFDNFTIRLFRITDYLPGEPGELFFRLNQPTNLTAAEQRNAFFGPARHQIKMLVSYLEVLGIDKDFLGFSNDRMAYDDVLARVCLTFEKGTLREKITAQSVTAKYRSDREFDGRVLSRVQSALEIFSAAREYITPQTRFNKATLYSWLCFLQAFSTAKESPNLSSRLGSYVASFELARQAVKSGQTFVRSVGLDFSTLQIEGIASQFSTPYARVMLPIFTDRSTSRVADVQSVLFRDLVLWFFYMSGFAGPELPAVLTQSKQDVLHGAEKVIAGTKSSEEAEFLLSQVVEQKGWGVSL